MDRVPGRFARAVDERALQRAVRRRAGLDGRAADRALRAVLREVAGGPTIGEAFDLAELLPGPLARECRLGALAGGPVRFSPRALVQAVAERERVTPEEATRHVTAVLTALREQLPDGRFDYLGELAARLAGPPEAAPAV